MVIPTPEGLLAALEHARATFGGPEWKRGLERMREIKERTGMDRILDEYEALFLHGSPQARGPTGDDRYFIQTHRDPPQIFRLLWPCARGARGPHRDPARPGAARWTGRPSRSCPAPTSWALPGRCSAPTTRASSSPTWTPVDWLER